MGLRSLFVQDRSYFGDESIVFPEVNHGNVHEHVLETLREKVPRQVKYGIKSHISGISQPISVCHYEHKPNRQVSKKFVQFFKASNIYSPRKVMRKDKKNAQVSPDNREYILVDKFSEHTAYDRTAKVSKKKLKESDLVHEPSTKKNREVHDQDSPDHISHSQESKTSTYVDVEGFESEPTQSVLSQLQGHHEEWPSSSQEILEKRQNSIQEEKSDEEENHKRKFVSKFLRIPDNPISTDSGRIKRQPDESVEIVSSLDSDITEAADLVPYIHKKLLQKQLISECRVTLTRIDPTQLKHSIPEAKKRKTVTSADHLLCEISNRKWLVEQIVPSNTMPIANKKGTDSVTSSFVFSLEDSDDYYQREKRLQKKQASHNIDRKSVDQSCDVSNKRKSRKKTQNEGDKHDTQDTLPGSSAAAESYNVSSSNGQIFLESQEARRETTFIPHEGTNNSSSVERKKTRFEKKRKLGEDISLKGAENVGETLQVLEHCSYRHASEETNTKKRRKISHANNDDVGNKSEYEETKKKKKKHKVSEEYEETKKKKKKHKVSEETSVENTECSMDFTHEESLKRKKKKKQESAVVNTEEGTSNSISPSEPVADETNHSVKRKNKKKRKEKKLQSGDKGADRKANDPDDILTITLDKSDSDQECESNKHTEEKSEKTEKYRNKEKTSKTEKETEDLTANMEGKDRRKKKKKKKSNKGLKTEVKKRKDKERRKMDRKERKAKEKEGLEKLPVLNEKRKKKKKEQEQNLHDSTENLDESVIILNSSNELNPVKEKKKHLDETVVQDCEMSGEVLEKSDQSNKSSEKKRKKKRLREDVTTDQDHLNSSVICLDASGNEIVNDEGDRKKNRKKLKLGNRSKVKDIANAGVIHSTSDSHSKQVVEHHNKNNENESSSSSEKREGKKADDLSTVNDSEIVSDEGDRGKNRKKLKLENRSKIKDIVNAGAIHSTSDSHSKQVVEHHKKNNENDSTSSSEKREGEKADDLSTVNESPELSDDFQPKTTKLKKTKKPKTTKRKKTKKESKIRFTGTTTMSPENISTSHWHRLSFDSNGPFTLQSEEAIVTLSSGTTVKSTSGRPITANAANHEVEAGDTEFTCDLNVRKDIPDAFSSHLLSPRPSSTFIESSNETEPLIEGRGNLRGLTQKLVTPVCCSLPPSSINSYDLSNARANKVPCTLVKSTSLGFLSTYQDDNEAEASENEEEAEALECEEEIEASESESSDISANIIEGRGNLRGLTQKISEKKSVLLSPDETSKDLDSNDFESQRASQNISPSRSLLQSSDSSIEDNFNESSAIQIEGRGDLRGLTQHLPQSRIVSQPSSDSSEYEGEQSRDSALKSPPKKSLKEMLESKLASRNSSVSSSASIFQQPTIVAETNEENESSSNSEISIRRPVEAQRKSKGSSRNSADKRGKVIKKPNDSKERRFLDESQFRCTRCKKDFTNVSDMCRHDCRDIIKKKVKPDSVRKLALPTHKCDQCGKTYIQRCHLLHHQRAAHLHHRPYVCDDCGMGFSEKQTLIVHQRYMHTGVSPYECNCCSKEFYTSSKLHIHYKRAHNLLQKYHCGNCHLSYFFRSDLNVHESTVHSKKIIKAVRRLDGTTIGSGLLK